MTSICSARQAEQPAGLDHLQRLVHQRGGIDGDLRPHLPGRDAAAPPSTRHVGQFGGACRGTARRWPVSTTRSHPRCGCPACAWKMALCSLSTGRMRAAASRGQVHDQRPGHDERFLVGHGDRLAGLERRPGAGQPRRADDGAERRRPHPHRRPCAARRLRRPATPYQERDASGRLAGTASGSVRATQRGLTTSGLLRKVFASSNGRRGRRFRGGPADGRRRPGSWCRWSRSSRARRPGGER